MFLRVLILAGILPMAAGADIMTDAPAAPAPRFDGHVTRADSRNALNSGDAAMTLPPDLIRGLIAAGLISGASGYKGKSGKDGKHGDRSGRHGDHDGPRDSDDGRGRDRWDDDRWGDGDRWREGDRWHDGDRWNDGDWWRLGGGRDGHRDGGDDDRRRGD